MSAAPSQQVLLEAARWFVELHSGEAGELEHQQWRAWLEAAPQHQQAWERATAMGQRLQQVPRDLGLATLNTPKQLGRRQAIKHLALLLGVSAVGYAALREQPWRSWTADYRTGTGERREWHLQDGTLLTLNTASAVNVRFDEQQRLLQLLDGEILIETGKDSRPLHVRTAEGTATPLGTRFLVRQQAGHTEVAVFSGQVALQPASALQPTQVLQAGQQAGFDQHGSLPVRPAAIDLLAWTHGMLIADGMTLADFTREIGRYRPGYLGCSAQVAALRISGAFPVTDSDRALAALEKELPVQVRRVTRYWASIEPREK